MTTATLVGFTIVTEEHAPSPTDVHGLNPYTVAHAVPGESRFSWNEVTSGYGSSDCTARVIVLRDCSYGEYDSSSAYSRANYEWVLENYGGWVVELGRSTHDGLALGLVIGSVVPTALLDTLAGLSDYPIIDEDMLYPIEQELAEEAIEWALPDLRSDLLRMFTGDAYDTMSDALDENLDAELFWDAVHATECYGYAETSCSWVWDRYEWPQIVAYVLDMLTTEN